MKICYIEEINRIYDKSVNSFTLDLVSDFSPFFMKKLLCKDMYFDT